MVWLKASLIATWMVLPMMLQQGVEEGAVNGEAEGTADTTSEGATAGTLEIVIVGRAQAMHAGWQSRWFHEYCYARKVWTKAQLTLKLRARRR